ncbi:MAG: cytochrome-c oxidase, cbb3-type subunit III [Rhodobacteraceae bacterium]|nr:cytochrome-c oxidase, cbb3-type subunit III [Paracoccaceae bacterium]
MSEDRDDVTGTDTTGHEWDGIKELNNPLPRWWLWTFYATIVWGIGYVIAYPAWPLVNGATAGLLGYSTRAEVAADIAAVDAQNAGLEAQLTAIDLGAIAADDPLHRYAVAGGAAVFRTNCSQCHGSGAAGAKGYPNLLDDDWLWGGSLEDIALTVRHGVRSDDDDDSRYSEMPAFGDLLEAEEITAVVQHVLNISGQDHDAGLAAMGEAVFADHCASCHGEQGEGMRDLGAPKLSDAIWLFGGDAEAITEIVTNSRFGVMPPWGTRLSEADVKAVTTYVHQLGGGE